MKSTLKQVTLNPRCQVNSGASLPASIPQFDRVHEEPMQRYAWLEFDEGMWHFLTDLYAMPAESTRRWKNSQVALKELMKEGWNVVRAYPGQHQVSGGAEAVVGYGLRRCWQYN